ncbi:MAG: hypothetical protein ACLP7J_00465 [Streptosporangiaceae bacterium]
MSGDDAIPNVDASIIRLALTQLRARNAHHQFEDLCRDFFRARISPDVLPATGPAGAGGDQGRDFETFSPLTGRPKSEKQIVGMCTLQVTNLAAKTGLPRRLR